MKYGFWDVSRDRKKAPITKSDRLLELLALVFAVVLIVLTGWLYSNAPDVVPSHFNIKGEADDWSGKEVYLFLSALFLFIMIVSALAAYNRKLVNLPIRLKEPVFYRQIGLIGRMCRVLTLCMGCLWLVMLLSLSSEFLSISSAACSILVVSCVMLTLAVVLFYTLKIWWIGKNC